MPALKIKQELHLRTDEAFDRPVPLSTQAVDTLRAVRWLTGRAPFVFPGARSGLKPISENAIGYLYNREGYKGRHVPHGWRSSFLTIMTEQAERELGADVRLLADRMIIDLMLARIAATLPNLSHGGSMPNNDVADVENAGCYFSCRIWFTVFLVHRLTARRKFAASLKPTFHATSSTLIRVVCRYSIASLRRTSSTIAP